ncbi:hypothetical protein [Gemmatimonas groenlandica]|uniref:Uncharacterized protein n=1 Tax=Gemmatimonas groenlandica TaxID=2732249 RepID=A0A6M4ISK1_9BACT|nr:hypothetical protein [Gemmatimonas groenlandica]QJR37630.1 hypothetical protein HKW67_19955 [Gemmatimonas groenlandica]
MKTSYTTEIGFLGLVIALSLVGFSSLFTGEQTGPNGYQAAHIVTSLAWLLLLMVQLVVIRQRRFERHRAIGLSIFGAGPVVVATLTMLTVHSAAHDAIIGRADQLVVQNVMVTVEVALLVFLAFLLRRNRTVHGAMLLSTALLFMGIALFFTLISYVPGYRSEGPGMMPRFGAAAQTSAIVGSVVGLLFFLKQRRGGWPWLLTSAFFFLNGFLQMSVDRADRTMALTQSVASIGRAPAFALGFTIFAALLWLAWRANPTSRTTREIEAAL